MMRSRTILLGAMLVMLAAGPVQAACDPGDKIDGTTANDARRKIEAAGFAQVRDLNKGCDNYWHGRAIKGGMAANVLVTPQGQVMTEGD